MRPCGYAPAMRALAERLDQGLGVQEPDPDGAARWRARADAGEGASR